MWWESPGVRCRDFFVCGYGRGVLLLGLFPPRNRTKEQRERLCPPYQPARSSACLPANVVTGVPRIEKDPHGGDVVIVPARPYARDTDRCARCGEHDRLYDRLGVRRWRHLDIGCTRLLLEHAPRRVTCAEHGVTVADGAVGETQERVHA